MLLFNDHQNDEGETQQKGLLSSALLILEKKNLLVAAPSLKKMMKCPMITHVMEIVRIPLKHVIAPRGLVVFIRARVFLMIEKQRNKRQENGTGWYEQINRIFSGCLSFGGNFFDRF